MRTIKRIIIHCSASSYGDAALFREWHVKGNGWDDIGYHGVILNGRRSSNKYIDADDGLLEEGRDEAIAGSHCYGANTNSLGICIVGTGAFDMFSNKQLETLFIKCAEWVKKYGIRIKDIDGHFSFPSAKVQGKTCPFDKSVIDPDHTIKFIRDCIDQIVKNEVN